MTGSVIRKFGPIQLGSDHVWSKRNEMKQILMKKSQNGSNCSKSKVRKQ